MACDSISSALLSWFVAGSIEYFDLINKGSHQFDHIFKGTHLFKHNKVDQGNYFYLRI